MILQLTDSVVVLTRNPYFSARAGKARHIFTACSFEHFIYSFSVITQSKKNIKHISYNSDTHTHTQHAKRKSLLVSFHTAKHSRSVNREKKWNLLFTVMEQGNVWKERSGSKFCLVNFFSSAHQTAVGQMHFFMVTHSYHLFMQHDSNLDSSGLTRNSFFFFNATLSWLKLE